jgi:large repetitive protein
VITVQINPGQENTTIPPASAVISARNEADPVVANDSAVSGTVAVSSPGLFITKAMSPTAGASGCSSASNPRVNECIEFLITVRNDTSTTQTNINMVDVLPVHLAFLSSSEAGYNPSVGDNTWTISSIAPGATYSMTIRATVLPSGGGLSFFNCTELGVVTSTCPNPPNRQTGHRIQINPQAALTITHNVNLANQPVGATAIYTITVNNTLLTAAATNVLVDADFELFGASLSYISDTSGGTYTPATGQWSIASIPANSSVTLTLNYQVIGTAGTNVTTTATITAADAPAVSGASDTASITITSDDIVLAQVTTRTGVNNRYYVGENVGLWTVTITNNTTSPQTGLVVTNDFIASPHLSCTAVTPSNGTFNCATGEWTLGTLNPGQSTSITLQATILASAGTNPAGTSISNTANVSFADSNPANNSDTDAIIVGQNQADVEINKGLSCPVMPPVSGTQCTYNIVLSNGAFPANSRVSGVVVTDVLPACLTYISDNQSTYNPAISDYTWNVAPFNPGGTTTLSINVQVTDACVGPVITNTAQITTSGTPADPDGSSPASASFQVASADLSVSKTVNDSTPNVGDTITFTIVVTNNGPTNTTGVAVTDILPLGLTFAGASATQGSYDSSSGVWTVGNLNNGASATLSLQAQVLPNAAGGVVTNTATISSFVLPDPVDANNSDSDFVSVPQADMQLVSKVVNDNTPDASAAVTFTITIRNNGPDAATNVIVNDPLPAGLSCVGGVTVNGSYNCGTGLWTVGNLSVGQTATLTINAIVTAAPGATVNNVAVIDADEYDPAAGNQSASVSLTVNSADLSLSMTNNNPTPNPVNGSVILTITATNNGPQSASGASVTVTLPAGMAYVSDNGAGAYVPGTGVWTVGNLNSGQSAVLQITVNASGAPGAVLTANGTLSSATGDPNAANNSASTSVTLQSADLSINKTVNNATPNTGDTVIFTVTVSNAGTSNATSVVVNDLLPAGLSHTGNTPSQGTYNPATGVWSVGVLNNGASATLAINATVMAAGGAVVNNSASVSADQGDPNSANNSESESITVAQADLSVSVAAAPNLITVGAQTTITLTVSNLGPQNATGVTVSAPIPAGLVWVSDTSGGAYNNSTGLWTVGGITNGATVTLDIVLTATTASTPSFNATLNPGSPSDPNAANNTDSETITINP